MRLVSLNVKRRRGGGRPGLFELAAAHRMQTVKLACRISRRTAPELDTIPTGSTATGNRLFFEAESHLARAAWAIYTKNRPPRRIIMGLDFRAGGSLRNAATFQADFRQGPSIGCLCCPPAPMATPT